MDAGVAGSGASDWRRGGAMTEGLARELERRMAVAMELVGQGELVRAERALSGVYDGQRALGAYAAAACAANNRAMVLGKLGRTSEALLAWTAALEAARDASDPRGLALAHVNRGAARERLDDAAGAQADWEAAAQAFQAVGERRGMAIALARRAGHSRSTAELRRRLAQAAAALERPTPCDLCSLLGSAGQATGPYALACSAQAMWLAFHTSGAIRAVAHVADTLVQRIGPASEAGTRVALVAFSLAMLQRDAPGFEATAEPLFRTLVRCAQARGVCEADLPRWLDSKPVAPDLAAAARDLEALVPHDAWLVR